LYALLLFPRQSTPTARLDYITVEMLGEYRNELIITSDKQEQSRADLMPKGSAQERQAEKVDYILSCSMLRMMRLIQ
jgi:hypothetical protein